MKPNKDAIFIACFVIIIFLGLYFFIITTYSLIGKYTERGIKSS